MTRSRHNGCGGTCGVCRPHKKWKSNSIEDQRPAVRRVLQDSVNYEKNPEPKPYCHTCDAEAEWIYAPGGADYCDACVPRGCSCWLDEDGTEELGADGRRQPCIEFYEVSEGK